jgi:Fur family ferric uptake transcriptional regulator
MTRRSARRIESRRTEQRQALARILEDAGRPLGVQELHDKARAVVPGLSVATVYRNLRLWLNEGWLVAVPVPGEADHYEVAGKARHHHFRCERCGRVFEVFGTPAGVDALTPDGFVLRELQLYLYGECAECHARPGREQAGRRHG